MAVNKKTRKRGRKNKRQKMKTKHNMRGGGASNGQMDIVKYHNIFLRKDNANEIRMIQQSSGTNLLNSITDRLHRLKNPISNNIYHYYELLNEDIIEKDRTTEKELLEAEKTILEDEKTAEKTKNSENWVWSELEN